LFYVVGAVGEKNTRLLRVFFLPPAPPVRPWFQFSLSSGGASRRLARLPVHATVGTQTSPSAIRVPHTWVWPAWSVADSRPSRSENSTCVHRQRV